MKQEEDEYIATNELPQPSHELPAPIEAAEGDIVVTEQTGELPSIEEINNTSMQETIDAPVTTAQESSRADESTQETTTDTPTTHEVEPSIVQESPTKEETPSDVQQESVNGLSASTNMAEYISELPTLQEVTAQELQEFTPAITSKYSNNE